MAQNGWLARGVVLLAVGALAGCQSRRPDFLTRVREDCVAGDRWACDLLDSLAHPKPIPPFGSPHARGDALLLVADGIGVNRRSGELGVAQLMQQGAGGDRSNAEAIPQALG